MLVYKYVDENCLAAILAAKRSVGVAPKVNLRILLHVSDKAGKQGDPHCHTGYETQGRCHQKSNTDVSVAPQEGPMFSKIIF